MQNNNTIKIYTAQRAEAKDSRCAIGKRLSGGKKEEGSLRRDR
jgi:hypothetical protein